MPCESLRQVCSASLKSLWSKDRFCLFIFSYRSSTGMIVPKKTLWESCAVCWLASEIRQRFKRQVYLHFNTQTSDISAAFWKKNIVFVENDKNQWGSEDGWHSDCLWEEFADVHFSIRVVTFHPWTGIIYIHQMKRNTFLEILVHFSTAVYPAPNILLFTTMPPVC